MKRSLLLAVAVVTVLCAGMASAATVRVMVDNGTYSPNDMTVAIGDVIQFVNVSNADHRVTSFNPRMPDQVGWIFDATLPPGGIFEWTVPAPSLRPTRDGDDGGTVGFFCPGHRQTAEHGHIHLGPPGPRPDPVVPKPDIP